MIELVTANGGEIVGEEYFLLDHPDYARTVDRIMSSSAEVVFNTTVPPGVAPFLEQLRKAGFKKRGGQLMCTYFEENRNLARRAAVRSGPRHIARVRISVYRDHPSGGASCPPRPPGWTGPRTRN